MGGKRERERDEGVGEGIKERKKVEGIGEWRKGEN